MVAKTNFILPLFEINQFSYKKFNIYIGFASHHQDKSQKVVSHEKNRIVKKQLQKKKNFLYKSTLLH